LKEVYEAVASKVMKMGKDIEVKPCKTYIPFYRKTQFLVVKAKKGFLYLGLPKPPDASQGGSVGVKGLGMPEKILSAIRIGSKADLTRGIIDRIAAAYADN
jgi:predicted transport protein